MKERSGDDERGIYFSVLGLERKLKRKRRVSLTFKLQRRVQAAARVYTWKKKRESESWR